MYRNSWKPKSDSPDFWQRNEPNRYRFLSPKERFDRLRLRSLEDNNRFIVRETTGIFPVMLYSDFETFVEMLKEQRITLVDYGFVDSGLAITFRSVDHAVRAKLLYPISDAD